MTAKKKEIENILKERSEKGSITCRDARNIAEKLKVPYKEVGRTANELKIKIKDCELGCF
jgi:LAO/AO transport system kinase